MFDCENKIFIWVRMSCVPHSIPKILLNFEYSLSTKQILQGAEAGRRKDRKKKDEQVWSLLIVFSQKLVEERDPWKDIIWNSPAMPKGPP